MHFSRTERRFLPAAPLVVALLWGGCATGVSDVRDESGPALVVASGPDQAPPGSPARSPARLPPPEDARDAQTYLSGALAALRANQPAHAALFLDAILKSDHLSDRGRANVYWLAADAHRQAGHDSAHADALGGFLVAAEVLPDDEDLRRREVEARAALVARRLKLDPSLGKSPLDAIRVEDARDVTGVAAELGCVEDGGATHGKEDRLLEERRLICREAGRVVLWFDVTQVR